MTTAFTRIQPALAFAAAELEAAPSLATLSARARLSPFHLHRLFLGVAGETPKQYTLRLRVCRGAALLLSTKHTVLDIALACGFASHEAFTRAFTRYFALTPRAYRARGFVLPTGATAAAQHADLIDEVGPCIGLFHVRSSGAVAGGEMEYSIVKQELAPQPALVVRQRVTRSGIASAIGASLPHVFHYAQQHGFALADKPFTRYVEVGPGLLTIEPGMQVVGAPVARTADAAVPAGPSGEHVLEITLPGGAVASTIHAGPYETLPDAYGALETWIEVQGLSSAGPPWECYITDPGEHPDPKDWRTAVYWPVK